MKKHGIIYLNHNIGRYEFMCKACELGKIIVNYCINNGQEINTAKLQKLLVIMHGKYLVKYDQPLFPENVLIWKCGVAIEEVDTQFREFGGGFNKKLTANLAVLSSENQIILETLNNYGDKDAFELNNDRRLKYLKDTFYQPNESVLVSNDEIKKVFMDNGL